MTDRADIPTFLDLVQRLTAPHQKTIGEHTQTVDGLLQQLREAIFVGMETGGTGSAFGSRMPLDASSADLLEEIDRQAAEVLAAVQPHTPTPLGTTEAYVRLWAGQTTEGKLFTVTVRQAVPNAYRVVKDAIEAGAKKIPPTVESVRKQYSAYQLAASWAERIDDLFNPPSTREIKAPCPSCDAEYVHRVKDGQHLRSAALNFVRDRQMRTVAAKCSNCPAQWVPSQFDWLAGALGISVADMLAEPEKPQRKPWGEKTDLPEGSYRLVDGVWVDALTGNSFADTRK